MQCLDNKVLETELDFPILTGQRREERTLIKVELSPKIAAFLQWNLTRKIHSSGDL